MIEKYCVDNGLGVDQVEDQDAKFWTLYARDASGESEALADFADRRSAEAAMAVYVERDALGEQVRALAAEVQNCRRFVAEHLGPESGIEFSGLSTEFADAILREVGAKAAEGFTAFCGDENSVFIETTSNYASLSDAVNIYAARIRAGEVQP